MNHPHSNRQLSSRLASLAAIILAAIALLPFHSAAQELAKRLIMKDGSYQSVSKYEIKGDRVRYLSAERPDWEEMPKDLVDWPATEKYEKDRAAGAAIPEAAALDKELEAERRAEEDLQPEVAPGLHLPDDGGVLMLDTIDGKAQLVDLHQNAGELNRDMKRNLLRSAINPIASTKQTIELPGAHAAIQAHASAPVFYLKPDEDTLRGVDESAEVMQTQKPQKPRPSQQPQQPSQQPQQPSQQPEQPEGPVVPFNRYFIVKAQTKNGKRTVADIKIAIYGKTSQEQNTVRTTITDVRGGWLKLSPVEALPPGEYAIVEMLGKEGMNLYVWDFGVSGK